MKDQQLEELLKKHFEKEAEHFSVKQTTKEQPPRKKPARSPLSWKKWVLTAACFLAVAGILAAVTLPGDPIGHIVSGSEGDGSIAAESGESHGDDSSGETSSRDEPPKPTEGAPWVNGTLSLTSVTYKSGNSALRMTAAMKQLSGESGGSENVAVSLEAGAVISGCADGRFLAITPTEGAHMDCDGVYYDIEKDEEFCLACHIRDAIADDPYYIDVCIRTLVEEHLIVKDEILAGAVDYAYLYNDLNNEDAHRLLADGGEVTYEGLGGSANGHRAEEYGKRISNFVYPVVRIMEYGQNKDRCLFTIGSARTDAVWGVYVYQLDTGTVVKLDGETVGLEQPINGYLSMTPEDLVSVNITAATGIYVNPDYTRILVTVPYFLESWEYDYANAVLVPVYCGQNVLVFDVEKKSYKALLGNQMEALPSAPTPIEPAKQFEDLIYFPVDGGRYSFYAEDRHYLLDGELLRVSLGEDGVYLAAMKVGGEYALYALENGEAVPSKEEYFVWEDNARVSVTDGSKECLREELPAASAVSADGGYVYLYFAGEDAITCLDVATKETGSITLPAEFLAQAENRTQFLLFLDATETKLVITYRQNEL
ncbi:MAG: hypothetical protein IJX82_02150 [Clostridia bacterium]|nr:hypothetical protein [Clostridia bacterium]